MRDSRSEAEDGSIFSIAFNGLKMFRPERKHVGRSSGWSRLILLLQFAAFQKTNMPCSFLMTK
jgi:hypothetical protein